MTDNGNEGKTANCHKCFDEIPWSLYGEALKTLNKQFNIYRASHINAVQLGRGSQLQAINMYVQNKKIAVHEAGHVMALWYGGSMNSVSRATIKHQWMHYHEPENHITPIRKYPLETQADFFEELCFCLSGRIAESMFFPEDSPHFPYFIRYEGSDIHKAINVAYYMTKVESGIKKDFLRIPQDFLEDVSCYLIRGYEATSDLLKSKAESLLRVAYELVYEGTLKADILLAILGPPKRRMMSLYDQYCAFSMQLRPRVKKKYCFNRRYRLKKTMKRKTKASCVSKRKKSKAQAKRSKNKKVSAMQKKKTRTTCKASCKRKRSTNSIAPKRRKTNNGQVISVF